LYKNIHNNISTNKYLYFIYLFSDSYHLFFLQICKLCQEGKPWEYQNKPTNRGAEA
jgi:hypothetical protein